MILNSYTCSLNPSIHSINSVDGSYSFELDRYFYEWKNTLLLRSAVAQPCFNLVRSVIHVLQLRSHSAPAACHIAALCSGPPDRAGPARQRHHNGKSKQTQRFPWRCQKTFSNSHAAGVPVNCFLTVTVYRLPSTEAESSSVDATSPGTQRQSVDTHSCFATTPAPSSVLLNWLPD